MRTSRGFKVKLRKFAYSLSAGRYLCLVFTSVELGTLETMCVSLLWALDKLDADP